MVRVRERHPLVVLPVFLALVLALLAIPLSAQNQAVVPDIGFEIEGNAALDRGGDYDWLTVDRPPGVLIADPNSKAETDPSTFRPNSKFDSPETWSIVPSQVGPGQNELTNVLSWLIVPGGLGEDRPNDLWLVLGMERTKQEGTFDLDFEFNQNEWDDLSRGPERTKGDLVVGFELKGNPTDKEKDLQVLILQFDDEKQPELCDVTPGIPNEPAMVNVGTDPCPPYGDSGWWYRFLADGAVLADSGLGQATMNEDPFSVPEWWPSSDAQGNPRDVIGPFQFAEAAINLTAFGVEADCLTFSSVHAKSRSSLEVESDLKDLAGPVPVGIICRLDVAKTCTGDVFWGDDIEYQVTVANTGNVPLLGVAVEDPLIGLSETVDLAPQESRTFTGAYNPFNTKSSSGRGDYFLFLPLIARRFESPSVQHEPPVRAPINGASGTITNTVTATSQYGSATITASDDCVTNYYVPEVSKDAQASLTRTYYWTVDKEVDDPGPITLYPADFATPEYAVTVRLDDPPYVDSEWAVKGTIRIDNPAPINANLLSVTDEVSPDIGAPVDCPSLTVPAGGSLTCTYAAQLPDDSERRNTAAATLINNNDGTTVFTGTASVDFGEADIEMIDEEVEVTDQFWNFGPDPLGTVRYDEVPVTFTYTRTIEAPGNVCELFAVPNTATITTNDTGWTKEATATVEVFELCTATIGYEDLPIALGNDWDYNDLVIDVSPYLDVSPEHGLLQLSLTVEQAPGAGPPAGLTAFRHTLHLQPYADELTCDGSFELTVIDGGVENVTTGDFWPGRDFLLIPDTADPPDSIELQIAFDAPGCPFDFSGFDPVTKYHGEWLFFDPWVEVHPRRLLEDYEIHVIRSGDEEEPRILTVPVDWQWPVPDGNRICNPYPKVTGCDPGPPTFVPFWWDN